MRGLCVVVAMLRVVAAFSAEPPTPPIRLPATEAIVVPAEVTEINSATVFVIEADIPCVVLASRAGYVNIIEAAGPLWIRGIYPEGKQYETRRFLAKHLFLVEAVSRGEVELLVVPNGLKTSRDVIRRTIVVSGEGPRPPPGPKPDPQPDPQPQPAAITLGLIAFADVETRSPDAARLLSSKYWNDLPSRHRTAIYTRQTGEVVGKAFMAELGGVPGEVLLIRDNTANRKLAVVPLPKTAEALEAEIKKWSTK